MCFLGGLGVFKDQRVLWPQRPCAVLFRGRSYMGGNLRTFESFDFQSMGLSIPFKTALPRNQELEPRG